MTQMSLCSQPSGSKPGDVTTTKRKPSPGRSVVAVAQGSALPASLQRLAEFLNEQVPRVEALAPEIRQYRVERMCRTPPYNRADDRARLTADLRALGVPRLEPEVALADKRPNIPLPDTERNQAGISRPSAIRHAELFSSVSTAKSLGKPARGSRLRSARPVSLIRGYLRIT
jgi:hypothetical protein